MDRVPLSISEAAILLTVDNVNLATVRRKSGTERLESPRRARLLLTGRRPVRMVRGTRRVPRGSGERSSPVITRELRSLERLPAARCGPRLTHGSRDAKRLSSLREICDFPLAKTLRVFATSRKALRAFRTTSLVRLRSLLHRGSPNGRPLSAPPWWLFGGQLCGLTPLRESPQWGVSVPYLSNEVSRRGTPELRVGEVNAFAQPVHGAFDVRFVGALYPDTDVFAGVTAELDPEGLLHLIEAI